MESLIDSRIVDDKIVVEYRDMVIGFLKENVVDHDVILTSRFSKMEGFNFDGDMRYSSSQAPPLMIKIRKGIVVLESNS